MARPHLDALFEQQAERKIDLDELEAGVPSLMTEVGQSVVLDALVKRLEGTPEDERFLPFHENSSIRGLQFNHRPPGPNNLILDTVTKNRLFWLLISSISYFGILDAVFARFRFFPSTAVSLKDCF